MVVVVVRSSVGTWRRDFAELLALDEDPGPMLPSSRGVEHFRGDLGSFSPFGSIDQLFEPELAYSPFLLLRHRELVLRL